MNVLEAIYARKSIRKFKDEIVPKEDILKMLEAATQAPSPKHQQNWNFVVVTNRELINKMADIVTASHEKLGEIAKTEKDRKFLSDLKLLCTEYNNMPFKSMQEKVEEFKNDDAEFLFLHIREPEEIEKAKKAFNAETILIIRDNIEQITSNMADKNVRDYNYDIVIYNNDTLEELKCKAMKFCIEHDCM